MEGEAGDGEVALWRYAWQAEEHVERRHSKENVNRYAECIRSDSGG